MAGLIRYTPSPVPSSPSDYQRYLKDEFDKIAAALKSTNDGMRDVLNVEPDKKYEGMTVTADGTNWDPGSGYGTYQFRSGAWVFVG